MAVLERKIVQIDEDKCNGCGICVDACHEGAIQMVNGKAKLVSDIYCDGLGDCLGPCPTGAISIITRPAEGYDEEAVAQRMAEKNKGAAPQPGGCPGMAMRELKKPAADPEPLACGCPGTMSRSLKEADSQPCGCGCECEMEEEEHVESELMNWPVQLRLVPPAAPYLKGADILLAADCAAVAVPGFHARYLKNKPVIIACPKLDDNAPQTAKLAEIVKTARPSSLTVLRMEVPCCGGLVRVAEEAVKQSGLTIPVKTVIVGIDGAEK